MPSAFTMQGGMVGSKRPLDETSRREVRPRVPASTLTPPIHQHTPAPSIANAHIREPTPPVSVHVHEATMNTQAACVVPRPQGDAPGAGLAVRHVKPWITPSNIISQPSAAIPWTGTASDPRVGPSSTATHASHSSMAATHAQLRSPFVKMEPCEAGSHPSRSAGPVDLLPPPRIEPRAASLAAPASSNQSSCPNAGPPLFPPCIGLTLPQALSSDGGPPPPLLSAPARQTSLPTRTGDRENILKHAAVAEVRRALSSEQSTRKATCSYGIRALPDSDLESCSDVGDEDYHPASHGGSRSERDSMRPAAQQAAAPLTAAVVAAGAPSATAVQDAAAASASRRAAAETTYAECTTVEMGRGGTPVEVFRNAGEAAMFCLRDLLAASGQPIKGVNKLKWRLGKELYRGSKDLPLSSQVHRARFNGRGPLRDVVSAHTAVIVFEHYLCGAHSGARRDEAEAFLQEIKTHCKVSVI